MTRKNGARRCQTARSDSPEILALVIFDVSNEEVINVVLHDLSGSLICSNSGVPEIKRITII